MTIGQRAVLSTLSLILHDSPGQSQEIEIVPERNRRTLAKFREVIL